MKAIGAATAIAIALTLSACEQSAVTPSGATSNDLELGKIEATTRDLEDSSVSVELKWTFRQHASSFPVAELPPVVLSNGSTVIRAVPDALPEWDNDVVRFKARINVPTEQWNKGCWQTYHWLEHAVASGPITCINQVL